VGGGLITYSQDCQQIEVMVHGKPLEQERNYVVASTDMEFAEFIDYLVIPFSQIEFEVPTIMPEVVEAYILGHTPIKPSRARRICLRAE
jgi:hypothetical protein